MRETEVAVAFLPSGKTVYVLPGTILLEAAAGADIVLDQPCGGMGRCGKCRVKVSGEAAAPTDPEREFFSAEELQAGWRLACQSDVCGPVSVEVPQESLLASSHKILARSTENTSAAADPPICKQYVEMTAPVRGDADADLVRLQKMTEPFRVDLELLRHVPGRLRDCGFHGTAVLADGVLIDFEPGNTETQSYAVAVDVGTTTLVGVLLDLHRGEEPAVALRLNPQTRFGDDVLSRILHTQENAGGLGELQDAVVKAVDEMIGELTDQAAIPREKIYEVTFSGNTTMQQLLCGVDPSPLGMVPFVPATDHAMSVSAAQLGLQIHPRGRAYMMPVIGGFVGGDTVSGILATGLAEGRGPTLLVDIGTNGEIVLWADGKLTAASTAAGPAFEGARISQGMRGCNGAIEKVVVNEELRINVIGNVPPVGLCGSGLIDTAAELLRHKLLLSNGRLLPRDELPGGVMPDLAERVVPHEGKPAFLLRVPADWSADRASDDIVRHLLEALREAGVSV